MKFFSGIKRSSTGKRGFTLIELLVVIAIIGILASIITVALGGAKGKSRDSRRIADIKNIQLALSLYYNDNLFYPINIYASSATISGSDPRNGLAPAYLPAVPNDPSRGTCTSLGTDPGCYAYTSYWVAVSGSNSCSILSNPQKIPVIYHIGAALEDTTNPSLLTPGGDIDSTLASFSTTYTPCTTGAYGQFDGNALNCAVGASAANPDNCYDLRP